MQKMNNNTFCSVDTAERNLISWSRIWIECWISFSCSKGAQVLLWVIIRMFFSLQQHCTKLLLNHCFPEDRSLLFLWLACHDFSEQKNVVFCTSSRSFSFLHAFIIVGVCDGDQIVKPTFSCMSYCEVPVEMRLTLQALMFLVFLIGQEKFAEALKIWLEFWRNYNKNIWALICVWMQACKSTVRCTYWDILLLGKRKITDGQTLSCRSHWNLWLC